MNHVKDTKSHKKINNLKHTHTVADKPIMAQVIRLLLACSVK